MMIVMIMMMTIMIGLHNVPEVRLEFRRERNQTSSSSSSSSSSSASFKAVYDGFLAHKF
jgi:hypothetical protein